MKNFLKKYTPVAIMLFLCVLAISFKPAPVKAQCDPSVSYSSNNPCYTIAHPTPAYTLLEPLPCIPSAAKTDSTGKVISTAVTCPNGNGNTVSSVNFQQYLQFFFNLVIALSAAAAVFMIAAGGLRLMTTDSWSGKEAGKKQVWNAVIGLIVVLCSYFLLQIIDPRLVQIPTTLVPPLNINYKNQTSAFFNDLVNQITTQDQNSALSAQNDQLRSAAYAAQNKVTDLESSKTDLEDQIANALVPTDPNSLSESDITSYCNSSAGASSNDPSIAKLCGSLNQTVQDENTVKGDIALKTALFTMNTQVMNCLGSGANSQGNSDKCDVTAQGNIADALNKAQQTLGDLGQVTQAREVLDYSNYSASMSSINNVLSTLQTSPGTMALYNGISQFNTTVDTALGAYLASPAMFQGVGQAIGTAGSTAGSVARGVGDMAYDINGVVTNSNLLKGATGAMAGYTIAQAGNGVMQSQISANDRQTAANASDQISQMVASTQDTIKDPDLKAAYQQQTTAILNALNTAAAGTKSTASKYVPSSDMQYYNPSL
jgi:hypothetical protein